MDFFFVFYATTWDGNVLYPGMISSKYGPAKVFIDEPAPIIDSLEESEKISRDSTHSMVKSQFSFSNSYYVPKEFEEVVLLKNRVMDLEKQIKERDQLIKTMKQASLQLV